MDRGITYATWAEVHEQKVLEALGVLGELRRRITLEAASAIDSAQALVRQSAQADRRSQQVLDEANRLLARAERLVAEARAIHAEHRCDP